MSEGKMDIQTTNSENNQSVGSSVGSNNSGGNNVNNNVGNNNVVNNNVINNSELDKIYNDIKPSAVVDANQSETKIPWYETNNQLKKFAPKDNETPEDALHKLANSYIELEKKMSSQGNKVPTEYNINTNDIQLNDKTIKNLLSDNEIQAIKEDAKFLQLTQEQCQNLYHIVNRDRMLAERYREQEQNERGEKILNKATEAMRGGPDSGEWADSSKYINEIIDYGADTLDNNINKETLRKEISVLLNNGITEVVKLLRALGDDYTGSESNLRMKERTAGFYGSTPADADYGKYSSKTLGEQYLKLVQSEAFRKGDANVKSQAENLRNILQKRGMLL